MSYKLLKFDVIHPKSYLEKKHEEWDDLEELSAAEYRNRLISLRSNYSDFYTYHLNERGWEAEEFFLNDEVYLKKVAKELFGWKYSVEKNVSRAKHKLRPFHWGWPQRVVQEYIKRYSPDVLFVRSQPLPSSFWLQFKDDCLLVSRLSARLPRLWHPDDWDLIYTDFEIFKDFFNAHDTSSIINSQGFDERILTELKDNEPKHDVVFIGGMGTQNFAARTHFFEKLAQNINFKWWGYWWEYGGWGSMDDFPNLKRTFQGATSGLDMYQIYNDSKIVLNDYVDVSRSYGFNQRMFEVMGVGAFMLTRHTANLNTDFPEDIFVTFSNLDDCLAKIEHYLKHEEERKKIGKNGQQFVLNNYEYADIVKKFDEELRKRLPKK